jgi:hypothetical protein
VASFLVTYLSGFVRALLVEMGIGEDLHIPVCKFLCFWGFLQKAPIIYGQNCRK